jgi:hypothetical protein
MLLLVVTGELIKQAKGRILLDLYRVSTRSPHSLQTVGMMLTATSKSLSVSEVCYGTRVWVSMAQYNTGGSSMELSSVVGVSVSDLQHAARAEIDRILKADT